MARKKITRVFRTAVRWIIGFIIFFLAVTLIQVYSLKYINPRFTVMTAWEWVQASKSAEKGLSGNIWLKLEEISPNLRRAVLAGEDQRFLSHHGFDLHEMNKAIRNLALKKGFRGASTITMQVARTVFLWPDRTWLRKIAEAYYTLLIEICWSKERILEIYLNTVDWGTGITGAEEASKIYFKTSASSITSSQAALLVAILPNPHKNSPNHPGPQILKRQKRILKDMRKMPLLS